MGCCEANGIRNRLEQINPFKQQRGITFDQSSQIIQHQYVRNQYLMTTLHNNTNPSHNIIPIKLNNFEYPDPLINSMTLTLTNLNSRLSTLQSNTESKLNRLFLVLQFDNNPTNTQVIKASQYNSILYLKSKISQKYHLIVPVSTLVQQPQYVINSQPQQSQTYVIEWISDNFRYFKQIIIHDYRFTIYPQSNNVSFRGDHHVNQILSNLNNQQQKLFKTTSKAIMKVEDDKLTNNDREVMQEIFHKLEKTSCFNSKKSSKSNLSGSMQMNSKELKKMYDQMNNQLQLLNKLIVCLDDKWNLQDSKQVKQQLKEFSEKVREFGEVTLHNSFIEQQMGDKSFRSQESSFLPKTNHTQVNEMDFSNLKEEEDSQIRQMKDIMQQYRNQTTEQSGLFQRDLNRSSFIGTKKQESKLSSERMKENNSKIDSLINKLHHLNQSYKLLSNE